MKKKIKKNNLPRRQAGKAKAVKRAKAKKKVIHKAKKRPEKRHRHERHEKTQVLKQSAFDWDKAVHDLARQGQQRGFITEAEILHSMPEIEENITALEKLYGELDRLGLEVVDQEVASIWEQGKAEPAGPRSKSV